MVPAYLILFVFPCVCRGGVGWGGGLCGTLCVCGWGEGGGFFLFFSFLHLCQVKQLHQLFLCFSFLLSSFIFLFLFF